MRRKYRRLFHQHGIHDYCVVEREIIGYDRSPKFLPGPLITEDDGNGNITQRREMYDVTTIFGDPIYGDKEVHNP